MNELGAADFISGFGHSLIQFEGIFLFALVAYWVAAQWRPLLRNFSTPIGEISFALSLLFGLGFAIVCGRELGPEFLLLTTAIGFSIALAFQNGTIAVCFLCAMLFFRPWELVENNDYLLLLPKFSFVICFAHAILALAFRRKSLPTWNRAATLVVLFSIWAYLTTFKADDPADARFYYFETFFKSAILFLVTLNSIWSRRDLEVLVVSLLITFFGIGVISLSQTIGYAHASHDPAVRLMGLGAYSNPNDIAALMVFVFPLALGRLLRAGVPWGLRAFSALLLVVSSVSIYWSQSRGAMLGLATAIGVLLVVRIRRRALNVAFICLLLIGMTGYLHYSSRDSEDLEESSASRWTFVKAGIMMGVKNPVFGVGFNSYARNFERYADELVEYGHRTAHNSWVLVLSETGVPGFLLYIATFFVSLKFAWRVFPVFPEFLLTMAGYGVAISFLSHSYLLYPFLLYGLIGAAHRVSVV